MKSLGRSQGCGTSQETPVTMIAPRLFHMMLFFGHPLLVKRDFLQAMDSLESIMGNNKGHGNLIMVELNPNILVWHVQRMHSAWCKVYDVNCLLHSVHWALSSVQCPVSSVHCTLLQIVESLPRLWCDQQWSRGAAWLRDHLVVFAWLYGANSEVILVTYQT